MDTGKSKGLEKSNGHRKDSLLERGGNHVPPLGQDGLQLSILDNKPRCSSQRESEKKAGWSFLWRLPDQTPRALVQSQTRMMCFCE